MAPRSISIGIPLYPWQALDIIGPVDILGNISHRMVSAYASPDVADKLAAPDISFHYIGTESTLTTANVHIAPTCSMSSCPKLDYLLLGGPDPAFAMSLPKELKDFIIERSKEVKAIWTTCTGGIVLAATGLLDDTAATTNHHPMIQKAAGHVSPSTKWDWGTHWVISKNRDGVNFWTAAGAGAGMDMIAQWMREELENGETLLNISTQALEWQPRDIDGKAMKHMNGRGEMVD